FRLHGPQYREQFGARLLPSHRRAMQDIEQCRTAALGGQLYFCNQCQQPLRYHPHVHYIVAGGGLTADGRWVASRKDFLVPVKALSSIFRAKFRDQLKKTARFAAVDQQAWKKKWVVHSQPVGSGQQAFQYLAPYIFRVALSNNRLCQLQEGQVTFAYKESATDQLKRCTLPTQEFIRRFLQHVLPPRFIKVRYYGLLSPAHRQLLQKARPLVPTTTRKLKPEVVNTTDPLTVLRCSHCHGPLTLLSPLAPRGRAP
ncbi:MAG: IS91 family transposase, partial [Pyrinomonadaceae bacterium]